MESISPRLFAARKATVILWSMKANLFHDQHFFALDEILLRRKSNQEKSIQDLVQTYVAKIIIHYK